MRSRKETGTWRRVKGCATRACEGPCAKGCTRAYTARVRAWVRGCVRATRARDVHDDYSDIVVIVEGTIARQ